METCFVMQVFDAIYDRRYEESFAPAIQDGGATPIRADKILGSKPIIDKIEGAIRKATIAFAEISEDNPNVFIELGYALDLGIPLVMVCDQAKRSALPFDITHRPVIFYRTESKGDFDKLSKDIQAAVGAALTDARERQEALSKSTPAPLTAVADDALRERIMLEILEGEIGDPDGISAYRITTALKSEGTSERLASLGLLALTHEGLIETTPSTDYNDNRYIAYRLSSDGRSHLLSQYADIKRREEAKSEEAKQRWTAKKQVPSNAFDDLDDDVPF